jgi:hypothetical protein
MRRDQESDETEFRWDVFLSHATQDKETVRPIAKRLKDHGLRVWFDEDSIPDGENIYSEIEAGLQNSHTVVFFASKFSLASEWAGLERKTAMFRNTNNKARKFIPIRLDDTQLPDVLAAIKYIDWNALQPEEAFQRLLDACSAQLPLRTEAVSYHHVFTPGVPPIYPELLVGRSEQLEKLLDLLKSPGIHPIVTGERGIGKTSLVNAAITRLGYARKSVLEVNTVPNFDECCRLVCEDLGLENSEETYNSARFLRKLKTLEIPAIVSIDELDDVPKNSDSRREFEDIRRSIGVFAKSASNQASDLKVKFVVFRNWSGCGRAFRWPRQLAKKPASSTPYRHKHRRPEQFPS